MKYKKALRATYAIVTVPPNADLYKCTAADFKSPGGGGDSTVAPFVRAKLMRLSILSLFFRDSDEVTSPTAELRRHICEHRIDVSFGLPPLPLPSIVNSAHAWQLSRGLIIGASLAVRAAQLSFTRQS